MLRITWDLLQGARGYILKLELTLLNYRSVAKLTGEGEWWFSSLTNILLIILTSRESMYGWMYADTSVLGTCFAWLVN